jgi:hypothetical protein
MLLFHRTSTEGDHVSMSSDLTDLFLAMDEAIIALMEHRLFVTEIGHPLDDPLDGTLVVNPDRIIAAINAAYPKLRAMPDPHPQPSFASA